MYSQRRVGAEMSSEDDVEVPAVDWRQWHGHKGSRDWELPVLAVESHVGVRPDQVLHCGPPPVAAADIWPVVYFRRCSFSSVCGVGVWHCTDAVVATRAAQHDQSARIPRHAGGV